MPQLPLGIVLPDLTSYRDLVHYIARSRDTLEVEFTYRYPLFKGNEKIKSGLERTQSALEKFDVYFKHGILNEDARVHFAQLFRQRYLTQFPSSEGQDVHQASGEVLQFRFVLKNPATVHDRVEVARGLTHYPHDREVVDEVESTGHIDPAHRTGHLALYLDHVYNPRRRADPRVQAVLDGALEDDPVIVELLTDGALPALFAHVIGAKVKKVGGELVLLEDKGDGR